MADAASGEGEPSGKFGKLIMLQQALKINLWKHFRFPVSRNEKRRKSEGQTKTTMHLNLP